jgi:hypothetical protein
MAQRKGLGWKPGRGTAPERFLLRAAPPPPAPPELRRRAWWRQGWWGDQKTTSQCVIYSWLHALHDGPLTPKEKLRLRAAPKPLAAPTPLYQEGQAIDGTPTWDVDSGLTCNAGAQVMKRHGWIGEYRWAETVDEVVNHLLVAGPVLIGAWWYDSMFDVGPDGKMEMDGALAGGHQWVMSAVDLDRERFDNKNSWNRSWGRRGMFYSSFRQVERMLAEGAEICCYRELPIAV